MRSCRRWSAGLLVQAVVFAQAPEMLVNSGRPAAFDAIRDRTVRVSNDRSTWEWDGSWFRRPIQAPDIGTGLGNNDMVFDLVRRQVVLCAKLGSPSASLHAYDGAQWTQLSLPSGQLPLHLVADVGRLRLVLLTTSPLDPALRSTFEDSGQGWVQVITPTRITNASPLGVPVESATYDPLTARTMLVTSGGANGNAAVWWYDGVDWTLQTVGTPPRQQQCALAFDPVRQVVVMFGGFTGFLSQVTDVWEWDGVAWTNRGPGAGVVVNSVFPSLVFDSTRG